MTYRNLDLEPKENKRGVYRPAVERTAFDAWVAKMILGGHSQANLVKLYKEEFGKSTTNHIVSDTIARLREEWKLSAPSDTAAYIGMELERLDGMEKLAWENYHKCGGTITNTEVKDHFLYDGEGKESHKNESLVTVTTRDDPRIAMQWFDKILKIQSARRKVLRLETKVNINNIMAVKGYAFFDPGKDWEQEPPNQPQANVIDSEFTESGNG